jgi:hypothetical protein
MAVIFGFMSGEIILELAAVASSSVIYVNKLIICNLFILSWMNGYYFYLCVNYSPSIILNDELIHIRLNLNDGAASKIGQYEQFHFADFVKIARLLLTEKKNNTFQSTRLPVQYIIRLGFYVEWLLSKYF